MQKKRIDFVDFLRVIAIFLVVIFHLLYEIIPDNKLRPIGFVGLSLFFIISGFVLSKVYPGHESFSLKWFLKRYIKIASLYYLALALVIILFSIQTYSGSLAKHILIHIFFLDYFFPPVQYSIISPAWFLAPLMGLYLIFPYLNKFMKKYPWLIIFAFLITLLLRMEDRAFTSYSPFFFLGEFCFGILMAYNKNLLAFASSFLVLIFNPLMFIAFPIFLVSSYIDFKYIPHKSLGIIGIYTFAIFLFHESFIKLFAGKWHIFNLSLPSEIAILSLSVLLCIFISNKLNNLILK